MKTIKYLLLSIFIFMINISFIKANDIYSIDINVLLDEEGNGTITEIWDMRVDEGTEVYKPFGDLGNSKITNFKVYDETGKTYTYLNNWNTSGTLSSKAYKNGINYTSDGLELCWGMSSYGKHTYIITYNVSNMIYNVDDAQILYWKLINDSMDPAPQKFNIVISGPDYYEDTLDVWGYGHKGGLAYVDNGKIYVSNNDERDFQSDEYQVILVKYPIDTFETDNHISDFHTFDEVKELADEGSLVYKESNAPIFIFIIISIFEVIFWPLLIFIVFKKIKNSGPNGNYIKQNIDNKNLNNFRDMPCDKDLFKGYFLSQIYNLNRKKEDFLGAIILKWIKNNEVKIVKQNKKTLFKNKEITAIDLTITSVFANNLEQELYNYMYKASNDGLLEEDELKKWCSNNYSKFFKWFDKVIEEVRNEYINEGKITVSETGRIIKTKKYTLDNSLYEEATKLAGLKKYLKEFSLIKEKEPIEVMLWEDYLIYAQIFGIANEVAKQFKNLYPELIESHNYGIDYTDIIWVNTITTSGVRSARSAAQRYSSGGGGFSSGGGGGGSFGGGHGGGCR